MSWINAITWLWLNIHLPKKNQSSLVVCCNPTLKSGWDKPRAIADGHPSVARSPGYCCLPFLVVPLQRKPSRALDTGKTPGGVGVYWSLVAVVVRLPGLPLCKFQKKELVLFGSAYVPYTKKYYIYIYTQNEHIDSIPLACDHLSYEIARISRNHQPVDHQTPRWHDRASLSAAHHSPSGGRCASKGPAILELNVLEGRS